MRQRRAELAADPGTVDAIVKSAGERARSVAHCTMERVRKAVGLR
jgi:tryptophanyl-tRNA synthetase